MSIKPSSSRVPSLFHFLCESLVFYRSVPQLHLYNVRTRSESPQLFIYALSLSLCLTFHSFLCKLSKTSYPEHSMKFSLQKLWTWTYTTQFLLQCIMNIIFLKHWNSWMELPNSVDFQFKPISSVKLRWALQGSWLFFLVFLFLTVSQVHGFVCTYKNDCELPACQLMKHSYHRQCKNADAVGQLIYSSSFHCCVTFLTVKLVARKFTRISSWYGSEQTRGH